MAGTAGHDNICMLFRPSQDSYDEYKVANKYFHAYQIRAQIPKKSLVIPRYSALPYFEELVEDLAYWGSRTINSVAQHSWIAGFHWYEDLKQYTPRSWFERDFYKCNIDGPFVIKGTTNSRKHQWNTHMFAADRRQAMRVASELANDPLIGPQGLIYREYVSLKTLEVCPIYGTPFVNEWRFFFYKTKLLCYGFYWSNASEETIKNAKITDEAIYFARIVAEKCAKHTNFFVLDIAEKESGGWTLIEVNDGMQSGLSECDADELYSNLMIATGAY